MSATIVEFVPAPRGVKRHKVGAKVLRFPAEHEQARRARVVARFAWLQGAMIELRAGAQKGVNGK